jgi:hypothetical protein
VAKGPTDNWATKSPNDPPSASPRRSLARRGALLVLVAGLAGGCGEQIGSARGDHLLRGGIRYSGGPRLPVDEHSYEAGTVNLEHDGHKVDVAKLMEGQRFEFKVRPGKYRLSTQLGDLGCERDVEVTKAVVDADLTCSVK